MSISPINTNDPGRTYSTFPSRNYKNIGGYETNPNNFTRFTPSEFKLGESRVTLNDVYSRAVFLAHQPPILDKEMKEVIDKDNGKWIGDLFSSKKTYEEMIKKVKSFGHTNEEAKELLDEAIYHSERAVDWSVANENYGGLSSDSIFLSACIGVLQTILSETEHSNETVNKVLSTAHNGLLGIRGYLQYGYVYGRNDDEKGVNNYQGEYYGNKTSSIFADLAYIFETKLNPIPLVLLGLFGSEKANETLIPLLYLPNPLWWRIRMPQEVRQDFVTDLFKFILNKPLALLKITESIRKVREIKEKGNLNYPYIQKRLVELIGLDPTKHRLKDVFPELAKLLKTLFSTDKNLAKDASHNIGKFLAPLLGLYGFTAFAFGIPIKSILKWLDIESKFINAFSMSGAASQQILYLFRMMMPEQFDNQMQKISQNNKGINALKAQKNKLFYSGVIICSASIISTLLKLINPENRLFKFSEKLIDQIVDKGIPYYFSERRELRGRGFRLSNPELFNSDGTSKIISDKVCAQEKPQTIAA